MEAQVVNTNAVNERIGADIAAFNPVAAKIARLEEYLTYTINSLDDKDGEAYLAKKQEEEAEAEAKYDLLFKSAKRSVDEFRSLKRSDKIDFTTSINLYRSVTGACAAGCKAFVAAKGIDKDRKYTIDEILKLTAGEYNNGPQA